MNNIKIIPVYFVPKGAKQRVFQHNIVSNGGHFIDVPGGCAIAFKQGDGYTITEEYTPAEIARMKRQSRHK